MRGSGVLSRQPPGARGGGCGPAALGALGRCGDVRHGRLRAELRPSAQLTLFLLGLNDSCRAPDTFNPVFMDEIL